MDSSAGFCIALNWKGKPARLVPLPEPEFEVDVELTSGGVNGVEVELVRGGVNGVDVELTRGATKGIDVGFWLAIVVR